MKQSRAPLSRVTSRDVSFTITTCILLVLAHAVAYMTHEYSHSLMAWALGWMDNPLALDYGKHTLDNFLFLGDVGDNVRYDPIFAAGHGLQVATIALAGTYLGNALLYFLLYLLAMSKVVSSSRLALSFVYWTSLMCAGNVWGYVPMRALTTHADIAIAARGLHLPFWGLFPILIVPSLYVVHHFFRKMSARCYPVLTAGSSNIKVLLIALTSYWFFSFFGGEGLDGSYGLISQLLSITSKYLLFPLCAVYLSSVYLHNKPETRDSAVPMRPASSWLEKAPKVNVCPESKK